ncbi:MAG: hypothetical protein ABI639_02560 [Thermoanaerobaculia bacterium]
MSFCEIPAADPPALAGFFLQVFGWASLPIPWDGPPYVRLLPPESNAASGAGILQPDASGLIDRLTMMIRIEGEALETVLARIAAAGGTLALEPVTIGAAGRFARFFDPAGNSFGLWQGIDDAEALRVG